MQSLKIFWRRFNLFLPFTDFVYILQQEEYSSQRLTKWLPRFYFKRGIQQREYLIYTIRAKLILSAALGLFSLIILGGLMLIESGWLKAFWILLVSYTVPAVVLVTNIATTPLFNLLKLRAQKKAAAKILRLKNLKIVSVAGSYGKTTVKNFIQQLVRFSYGSQMIPGNINTPDGIANWVLTRLDSSTELLIAEVDAYHIGEIYLSGRILNPDIALLTNVGDQHLERFGNRQNLSIALNEVFTTAKAKAKLITTDEVIAEFPLIANEISKENLNIISKIENINYLQNNILADNLSDSNKINLMFALKVAEILQVPASFVIDSVAKLELPERRQQLSTLYGYEAIDDSYNISFTTAQAGIKAAKAASTKAGKKLLIVTAGIPELAADSQDNIIKLGEIAAKNAEHVVILGSVFAQQLASGITDKQKYSIRPNLSSFIRTAHVEFPPQEWFLLMQPELGDLYY